MLHEFKMLRLLNYGYYCEEIWNEEENHPDKFKEGAIVEYEADEFKYEKATRKQWEKYVQDEGEPLAIVFFKALESYNKDFDEKYKKWKSKTFPLLSKGLNIPLDILEVLSAKDMFFILRYKY